MTSNTPLILLTGASGAGKTHLTNALSSHPSTPPVHVYHFDNIGVPSPEDMTIHYGSPSGWQRFAMVAWATALACTATDGCMLLEGQVDPVFALTACKAAGLTNVALVAVHATHAVRETRLITLRQQPELATSQMRRWATAIRHRTEQLGGLVLDTSASDTETNVAQLRQLIATRLTHYP